MGAGADAISDGKIASVVGRENVYDLMKRKGIPSTLTDAEIAAANVVDLRMQAGKKGRAPHHDKIDVPKELHHKKGRDVPNPHNIDNLEPLWPWEHADIDPDRHYKGPRPEGE